MKLLWVTKPHGDSCTQNIGGHSRQHLNQSSCMRNHPKIALQNEFDVTEECIWYWHLRKHQDHYNHWFAGCVPRLPEECVASACCTRVTTDRRKQIPCSVCSSDHRWGLHSGQREHTHAHPSTNFPGAVDKSGGERRHWEHLHRSAHLRPHHWAIHRARQKLQLGIKCRHIQTYTRNTYSSPSAIG